MDRQHSMQKPWMSHYLSNNTPSGFSMLHYPYYRSLPISSRTSRYGKQYEWVIVSAMSACRDPFFFFFFLLTAYHLRTSRLLCCCSRYRRTHVYNPMDLWRTQKLYRPENRIGNFGSRTTSSTSASCYEVNRGSSAWERWRQKRKVAR